MTDQEENDLLERRRAMPLGERLMTWRDQCGLMPVDKAFQDLGECVAALGAMIPAHSTPAVGKYGSSLNFVGGILHINVSGYGKGNGTGYISVKDDDMKWDTGEDGKEWRIIPLLRSELEAIRDHLSTWLAASPKDEVGEKEPRSPGLSHREETPGVCPRGQT